MRSVRVVIVGGGIRGLSAALALRAAGAEVRVYKQAAAATSSPNRARTMALRATR
jgi:2-polyprenyl-6-methoxyphenol hydroxylase-like FAD-dependent oxidoreductase